MPSNNNFPEIKTKVTTINNFDITPPIPVVSTDIHSKPNTPEALFNLQPRRRYHTKTVKFVSKPEHISNSQATPVYTPVRKPQVPNRQTVYKHNTVSTMENKSKFTEPIFIDLSSLPKKEVLPMANESPKIDPNLVSLSSLSFGQSLNVAVANAMADSLKGAKTVEIKSATQNNDKHLRLESIRSEDFVSLNDGLRSPSQAVTRIQVPVKSEYNIKPAPVVNLNMHEESAPLPFKVGAVDVYPASSKYTPGTSLQSPSPKNTLKASDYALNYDKTVIKSQIPSFGQKPVHVPIVIPNVDTYSTASVDPSVGLDTLFGYITDEKMPITKRIRRPTPIKRKVKTTLAELEMVIGSLSEPSNQPNNDRPTMINKPPPLANTKHYEINHIHMDKINHDNSPILVDVFPAPIRQEMHNRQTNVFTFTNKHINEVDSKNQASSDQITKDKSRKYLNSKKDYIESAYKTQQTGVTSTTKTKTPYSQRTPIRYDTKNKAQINSQSGHLTQSHTQSVHKTHNQLQSGHKTQSQLPPGYKTQRQSYTQSYIQPGQKTQNKFRFGHKTQSNFQPEHNTKSSSRPGHNTISHSHSGYKTQDNSKSKHTFTSKNTRDGSDVYNTPKGLRSHGRISTAGKIYKKSEFDPKVFGLSLQAFESDPAMVIPVERRTTHYNSHNQHPVSRYVNKPRNHVRTRPHYNPLAKEEYHNKDEKPRSYHSSRSMSTPTNVRSSQNRNNQFINSRHPGSLQHRASPQQMHRPNTKRYKTLSRHNNHQSGKSNMQANTRQMISNKQPPSLKSKSLSNKERQHQNIVLYDPGFNALSDRGVIDIPTETSSTVSIVGNNLSMQGKRTGNNRHNHHSNGRHVKASAFHHNRKQINTKYHIENKGTFKSQTKEKISSTYVPNNNVDIHRKSISNTYHDTVVRPEPIKHTAKTTRRQLTVPRKQAVGSTRTISVMTGQPRNKHVSQYINTRYRHAPSNGRYSTTYATKKSDTPHSRFQPHFKRMTSSTSTRSQSSGRHVKPFVKLSEMNTEHTRNSHNTHQSTHNTHPKDHVGGFAGVVNSNTFSAAKRRRIKVNSRSEKIAARGMRYANMYQPRRMATHSRIQSNN